MIPDYGTHSGIDYIAAPEAEKNHCTGCLFIRGNKDDCVSGTGDICEGDHDDYKGSPCIFVKRTKQSLKDNLLWRTRRRLGVL